MSGALGRTVALVVRKKLRDLVRDPRTLLISPVLPLLSTAAPRSGIVLGKFLAALIAGSGLDPPSGKPV